METTTTETMTPKIKITIEPHPSILNNLSLNECIDTDILDKLINSKLLKNEFNNKICQEKFVNEKEQLIKYKKLVKKGAAVIKYSKNKNNPYGRCNPQNGLGLFNIRRELRQTLTKKRFVDIDIKNAHPTMLLEIMLHNNIPVNRLKDYVENRQNWFDFITGEYKCSEEQAKTLMIIYTYGGGFNKWLEKEKLPTTFQEHIELTAFKNEVKHFQETITRHNPDLTKIAKKIKMDNGIDTYNTEGTVCSYFLQEYEVRILELLYRYCINNKIIQNNIAILCADGLMIEKEFYNDDLLEKFNEIVKNEIGFDLMFVKKEMTQDYLDILNDNLIPDEIETEPEPIIDQKGIDKLTELFKMEDKLNIEIVGSTDAALAKIFNKLCFDEKVIFTGMGKEPIGYIYNDIYWEELSLSNAELMKDNFDKMGEFFKEKMMILMKITEKMEEKTEQRRKMEARVNKYCEVAARCGKYTERRNILKVFQSDNYIKNVEWNKNPDLFAFEDCIYDLSTGKFQEKTDQKDFINITCGRFYKNEFNGDDIKTAEIEVEEFIQSILLPEDYPYVMKQLASFLRQENKDERGHFWLGLGRNGKGTLCDLVKGIIGNYWGELSIDYYTCYTKDKDRPNQNLYNCRNARVLNTSEIDDDNGNGKEVSFISGAYKNITGGDLIYARELGTKNTAYFKAGKTLIQTNILPKFSKIGISLKERIVIINFPYVFVNDDRIFTEPNKYKQKNSSLKDKFKGDIYKIALTNILFRYYKEYVKDFTIPPSIKAYTQSYFNSVNVVELILTNCEADENERISFENLKYLIKNEFNKDYTNKQLITELEENKLKVVKIKGYYYLKGYKLTEDDENETDNEVEVEDNTTEEVY